MERPEPTVQSLIQILTETNTVKKAVLQQLEAIQTAAAKAEIKQALAALLPLLDSVNDDLLKEWLQLAFLGTCVGFIERNLNPQHPDHQYIYPKLMDDITKIHQRIKAEGIAYDPDHLKFQVYDYGIQWVYYLDWILYMSQELY